MKIVMAARGYGKTTFIANYMKVNSRAVLLTIHTGEADRFKRLYPELRDRVYSKDEALRRPPRLNVNSEVIVDNIDLMFQSFFPGFPLKFVTMSEDSIVRLDE